MLGLFGLLAGVLAAASSIFIWCGRAGIGRVECDAPPVLSRVRLDPIQRILEMRAYSAPVDVSAPLEQMTQPYMATGIITIAGATAHVGMVQGMVTRQALRDLHAQLRDRGVRSMSWERHRKDGTVKAVTRNI